MTWEARQREIPVSSEVKSLCWAGESLVDWAAGGITFHLDGKIEPRPVYYAHPFNSAVTSPCGTYAVIYERLGTKGVLLKRGKVLRELNRSYYHASAYEYPVACEVVAPRDLKCHSLHRARRRVAKICTPQPEDGFLTCRKRDVQTQSATKQENVRLDFS